MKRFPKSTELQTLLFKREKWTESAAEQWCREHGYKDTIDKKAKGENIRVRQRAPFDFQKGTFRTIPLGAKHRGIQAVIAVPRAGKSTPKRRNNPVRGNPGKAPIARIPSKLIDLATARSIELEDGRELKFSVAGNFALCSTQDGHQLWIMSRSGGKRVQTEETDETDLFERFTGYEASSKGRLVSFPARPMIQIGRAVNIVYRSDKFARKEHEYIHPFNRTPTVSVDNINRPKIVALRGGAIQVTAEGIKG